MWDSICVVWLGVVFLSLNFFQCCVKMYGDQWMYDSITSKEVDMNEENEKEPSVNEENGEKASVHQHVDCSNTFNTSKVLICFFLLK